MRSNTSLTLRLIDCRMKREKRNFFQVERRNRRCLLSCSVCGLASGRNGCCDTSDDSNDTGNVRCLLFSKSSIFTWFSSSILPVCTDWLQLFDVLIDDFALVDAFFIALSAFVLFVLLLFLTRRDRRNKLRGIENARRTNFFFSLNACVILASSLLIIELGLAVAVGVVFVFDCFCCCCCRDGDSGACWLMWSFWSSLGIFYQYYYIWNRSVLINTNKLPINIWIYVYTRTHRA